MIPSSYDAPDIREGSVLMRGDDRQTGSMFSYLSPEERIPADHPLRPIRRMTDTVLRGLSAQFDRLYSDIGRPSIPPEKLLRALLLQVLYTVRSERLLMEQLQYNLLFRWFVGLSMDDPVWVSTVFSKNRDRLLEGDIAAAFFDAVVAEAKAAGLLSDEHFTVDGTQLEAWASLKSFTRRGAPPSEPPDDPGNPTVNFRGEKRSNATHQSTTDPDAQLFKKADGQKSVLAYLGHLLMENRHGLIVNVCATAATGTAERDAAVMMLAAGGRRCRTVGGDKNYDVASCVEALRDLGVTPHVAQKVQFTAIDGRTTRQPGYAVSQRKRKLVEQAFGWMKTIGPLRKLHHRGGELVDWNMTFTAAAYNLIRLRTLLAGA
jgi:transposase